MIDITKMSFFRITVAIVTVFVTLVVIVLGLRWIESNLGATDAVIVSLILLAVASYVIRNIRERGQDD